MSLDRHPNTSGDPVRTTVLPAALTTNRPAVTLTSKWVKHGRLEEIEGEKLSQSKETRVLSPISVNLANCSRPAGVPDTLILMGSGQMTTSTLSDILTLSGKITKDDPHAEQFQRQCAYVASDQTTLGRSGNRGLACNTPQCLSEGFLPHGYPPG
jgi:hypothetical protein